MFCGKPPTERSKEHILPQWLLRMTGDPKRQGIFGQNAPGGRRGVRVFAFDQFTFPACLDCNAHYSVLEGLARPVVERLLNRQPLSEVECDVFLEWLDKVRIGMWLGNRYLSGNIADVEPQFHIASRTGTADRMAWIMRDDLADGLNILGTETPMFSIMPSVFGLRINDLLILSASTDLMIGGPLGFPSASKRWTELGKSGVAITFSPGTGRIRAPIFPVPSRLAALKLYQPIFSKFLPDVDGHWDNDHVRAHSLDWATGKGRVFVDGWDGLRPGGVKVEDYCRSEGAVGDKRYLQFGANVLEVQNGLMWTLASMTRLPPRIRRLEAKRFRFTHGYNRRLIEAYLSGRVVNSRAEVDRINAGEIRAHGA